MKKLRARLLVLVMVLSLAACAAKTETADAPAEKPAPPKLCVFRGAPNFAACCLTARREYAILYLAIQNT